MEKNRIHSGVWKTFLALSTNSGSGFIWRLVSMPNAALMMTSKANKLKRLAASALSPEIRGFWMKQIVRKSTRNGLETN